MDTNKNKCSGGAIVVIPNKNKRDASLSSNMVTPPTAKRHQGQPSNSAATNMSSSSVDQVAIQGGSPTSAGTKQSPPSMALPKYEERTKVGQVVISYSPSSKAKSIVPTHEEEEEKKKVRCIISEIDAGTVGKYNVTKPYRHMFTTMEDRAKALEQHLVERRNVMIEQHGLSTDNSDFSKNDSEDNDDQAQHSNCIFAPLEEVNVPRQDKLTCIGRICNEVSHWNVLYTVGKNGISQQLTYFPFFNVLFLLTRNNLYFAIKNFRPIRVS
jgi:hypothetical protein